MKLRFPQLCPRLIRRCGTLMASLAMCASVTPAAAADPLLDEIVEFTGVVEFFEAGVPGVVIGAVRGDETAVFGFGETATDSGTEPNGQTLLRSGSITKAFTGEVLAHLAADGVVGFTDPLAAHLDLGGTPPAVDGRAVRLIDLATHSAGLPREVPHQPGPKDDPFRPITMEAFAAWLAGNELLFKPGSAVLYSNFGFDLLAAALASAAEQPYAALLAERITEPLGMRDTTFSPTAAQKANMMQGHWFDGSPMPDVPTAPAIVGSGGLYSTPNDLLRWMKWHLDRFAAAGAEARLLDHAAYLQRDGLATVSGMDESGHMDAVGLAWVVMMGDGDRPLVLQKAGGLQGTFSYLAFAPTRGVAVFIAINQFDFGAAINMAALANDLIAVLAPR